MTNRTRLILGLVCVLLAACSRSEKKPKKEEEPPSQRPPAPEQFFVGNATIFDSLGTPSGGCGVPQGLLETQNFVALNVQDTPRNYGPGLRRPISNPAVTGLFANGKNCGRWVRVVIDDRCQGLNDGAAGQPFCRGAKAEWQQDEINGATLDMIVTDSCQDNNAWCRDDKYHLDLATGSLKEFVKDGKKVTELAARWDNRRIKWSFVKAPAGLGPVKFSFPKGSSPAWPAVLVTHLPNGIHGVEAKVNGEWQSATMLSDLGQIYILPTEAERPYEIRIKDADDKYVENGKIFTIDFKTNCCQPGDVIP